MFQAAIPAMIFALIPAQADITEMHEFLSPQNFQIEQMKLQLLAIMEEDERRAEREYCTINLHMCSFDDGKGGVPLRGIRHDGWSGGRPGIDWIPIKLAEPE